MMRTERQREVNAAACGMLVAAGLLWVVARGAEAWTSAPSPHDGAHPVVVRPDAFADGQGKTVKTAQTAGSVFGTAASVTAPMSAKVEVRFAGAYTLWLRVGQAKGPKAPVTAELLRDGTAVMTATINDGPGSAGRGGARGYAAYAEVAMKTRPDGRVEDTGAALAPGGDNAEARVIDKTVFAAMKRGEGKRNWVHMMRVEQVSTTLPFYWWKVGTATLRPGTYQLRLRPAEVGGATGPALFDAAFLTTFAGLVYPYTGDIDAPPASYIRFRIDRLPKSGVTISAMMRVHYDPWQTGRAWLNPTGLNAKSAQAHTATGYTPWYRLQDLERAPGFGGGMAHLLLSVAGGTVGGEVDGATQFAVYPHPDDVLREIGWSEPEGLSMSMAPDFKTYLHLLRTLRDHARENYERAVTATGDRVFPLTRGELYLGNAWGYARGDDLNDYMVKTLRLLGFNSTSVARDPVGNRRRYGWTSHAGQYWPPAFMPYDDEAAGKKYDAHYAHYFDKQRAFYEGVTTYQIADEPGEIGRTEMSSPLWRYQAAGKAGKWVDAPGNSDLNTRRTDYQDCVLEGIVEKHGQWFGFRVALDDAKHPKRYAYWHVGHVAWSQEMNLAAGTVGMGPSRGNTMARKGAAVSPTGTKFKIVFEGGMAALYLNGVLIHQHTGVPKAGGFGFTGPPKAISALRFRVIGKGEHIAAQSPGVSSDELQGFAVERDDLAMDLAKRRVPKWAKPKPLEQFVEEDWVVSGGMPEAHAAFRKWAAAQGLTPEFFGRKSWDEVRMLTITSLISSPAEARLFYWSRRYCGSLTPRMFTLAAEAIHNNAPNKGMKGFVALSGHALYFPSTLPLDMFQLAQGGRFLMPGISDWMSMGGWRWDSHQAVAYSVAPYNAGARRYGRAPISYPMMHCVWPSAFRAYTMLANNVRYVSFYNYGPAYQVTEGYWSEADWAYQSVHATNNRVAQVDDILAHARMRPSRVAMLYSMANEYWNPQSSFADKRATFLGLSHEYYQPELVTEDQVDAGALAHYDALYVLDPIVKASVQTRIGEWVRAGGLLWACADAMRLNEFNEPADLLAAQMGVRREFGTQAAKPRTRRRRAKQPASKAIVMSAADGAPAFRAHSVFTGGMATSVEAEGARVLAHYDDGAPAWIEKTIGQGKVVYLGHRCGLTYTSKATRLGGMPVVWADTGRASLVRPLREAGVPRQLALSEPLIVASPMSSPDGTVIILYNMLATPCVNVAVTLKEPAAPRSVEMFEGFDLKPLPFKFENGAVHAVIPRLAAEQMIVVRRGPKPADDRIEKLHARTVAMLASTDWNDLSAGAWFAGFFPAWELGPKLIPLLGHERWQVRRAAAEAQGRMKCKAAADALLNAAKTEKDAHALGDMLVALARVRPEGLVELAGKCLLNPHAFVRQQTMRAARIAAQALEPGAAAIAFYREVAGVGVADPDLRVRREGIRLFTLLNPHGALELAIDGRRDRNEWVGAVAGSDAAFGEWLKRDMPGGRGLFEALAARRRDPKITARLLADFDTYGGSPNMLRMALTQNSRELAGRLLRNRDKVHKTTRAYLTMILAHAYGARLGNNVSDWEGFLK